MSPARSGGVVKLAQPGERPIADEVERFLDHCRAKGLSPKTVRDAYGYPLRSILVPWAQGRGLERVGELTPDELESLAASLYARLTPKGTPLSPYSVRAYLKSVKQFLAYESEQRHVQEVSARALPLPRKKKIARDVLSREEIDQLEAAAVSERDKMLIRIMADTGAREGEVLALRARDLIVRDSGRRFYLYFNGKTGPRETPIEPSLARRIRDYLGGDWDRPKVRREDELMWLSARRSPGRKERAVLTGSGLRKAVLDAADRAGFERRVYPHLLRGSAITYMSVGDARRAPMHPGMVSKVTGVSVAVIVEHYLMTTPVQDHDEMMRVLGGL